MARMVKELIGSIRKDGAKYRLERDEDVWTVRSGRQLFSGALEDLDEFCKEKGLLFLIPEDKVKGLKADLIVEDDIPVEEAESAGVSKSPEADIVVEAETVEEKPAEEVLEEALEIAEEVVVEAITTEPDTFEEDEKLVIEARKDKDAKIAQLKAQIAELKK